MSPSPVLQEIEHATARSVAVRAARADLRRTLRAPVTRREAWHLAADAVQNPHPDVAGMRVGTLLEACRLTHIRTVWRLLTKAGIRFESVEVGALTDRQRTALADALREGSI